MSDYNLGGRPQSYQGTLPHEDTERRAKRASTALKAVFNLLEAHDDTAAAELLDRISDRMHSEGPR